MTVVDRQAEGANTSRAAVVHPQTLELLEPYGDVVDELVARGVHTPTFTIRDRDDLLIAVPFSELPTRYPYTLMISQADTEALPAQPAGGAGRQGACARPSVSGIRQSGRVRDRHVRRRRADPGPVSGRCRRHAQHGPRTRPVSRSAAARTANRSHSPMSACPAVCRPTRSSCTSRRPGWWWSPLARRAVPHRRHGGRGAAAPRHRVRAVTAGRARPGRQTGGGRRSRPGVRASVSITGSPTLSATTRILLAGDAAPTCTRPPADRA